MIRKRDTVCEPASSPRNFWEDRNWVTCFVLQKDVSKSPSKKAGLLTPKFPSGLRSPFRLALLSVSANFPWDGWDVQVAVRSPSPSRLSLVTLGTIRVVVATRLLTVTSIAFRWDAIRLWGLNFLLCWKFVFSFPFILTAIGFCIGRRCAVRVSGIVVQRRMGRFSIGHGFTNITTVIRL